LPPFNDLQKYSCCGSADANETLYYAVLMSDRRLHANRFTPTSARHAKNSVISSRAARHVLPVSSRGPLKELLSNWPERDVRFIVVTDGERISVSAISEPAGWHPTSQALALHRLRRRAAAILLCPSSRVGTNNQVLLDDPLYQGCASTACAAKSISRLSTKSSAAVEQLYPKCCIQWEDFANFNAVPVLARYRDKICTFNDDIQGTAGVALAGIYGALRIPAEASEQRFLFLAAARPRPGSPS
jgi:malate dehydrogenase (oxaloacetate-decarboxylating)(NADP+)